MKIFNNINGKYPFDNYFKILETKNPRSIDICVICKKKIGFSNNDNYILRVLFKLSYHPSLRIEKRMIGLKRILNVDTSEKIIIYPLEIPIHNEHCLDILCSEVFSNYDRSDNLI